MKPLLIAAALAFPRQDPAGWIQLLEDIFRTGRIVCFCALPLLIAWIFIRKIARSIAKRSDEVIFRDVWKRALEESNRQNVIDVPRDDRRRVFPVTLRELEVCRRRGFCEKIAGLRLELAE